MRFRYEGPRRLYERGDRRFVPAQRGAKIERILARLDVAGEPADMNLPGFQLHLAARQPGRASGPSAFRGTGASSSASWRGTSATWTWWITTEVEGVKEFVMPMHSPPHPGLVRSP